MIKNKRLTNSLYINNQTLCLVLGPSLFGCNGSLESSMVVLGPPILWKIFSFFSCLKHFSPVHSNIQNSLEMLNWVQVQLLAGSRQDLPRLSKATPGFSQRYASHGL